MINRTTLIGLAALTFVLFGANAAMGQNFGEGNALLWTIGDIVWVAFLGCALALIVLSLTVLVRAMARGRRPHSRRA